MKWVIFCILGVYAVQAQDIKSLQYSGLKVTDSNKTVEIERKRGDKCIDIPITPKSVYSGNYADESTPAECKKTFITTLGSMQPISIDKDIKTVGELEVLEHIKKTQNKPSKYILIDSRKHNWYKHMTIPSAVNLPYNEINYDKDFPEDFKRLLELLNITKDRENFDFSKAKTAVLFCNGSWCPQSPRAIFKLVDLGYPKDKLLWYRGGIQDWLAYNFTVLKNP